MEMDTISFLFQIQLVLINIIETHFLYQKANHKEVYILFCETTGIFHF